jgi:adenylate cyclase
LLPKQPAKERRLAAIPAADVAGYSRLMSADEEGTVKMLNLYRGLMTDLVQEQQGRIVGTSQVLYPVLPRSR